MCNEVLGLCKSPVIKEINVHDVVNRILATKPSKIANDDFINNLYADMAADTAARETIRAVHISDVHIDTLYAAGSKAFCGSYLCCRDSYGEVGPGEEAAGEWGNDSSGVCDIPMKTFQSLL